MAQLENLKYVKLEDNFAELIEGSDEVYTLYGNVHDFSIFSDIPEGSTFICMANVGRITLAIIEKSIRIIDTQAVDSDWSEVAGIWLSPEEKSVFDVVANIALSGGYVNMTYVGLSGLGKTARAQALADMLDFDFVNVDCGGIQSKRDWFYTREVVDGNTVDHLTELAEKLPCGNLVVLLDDFNRVQPALHNPLISLLDYRHKVNVLHQTISAGPGTVFIRTENEGNGFVGTQAVDLAIDNRFEITLEATYPPKAVEQAIINARYELNGTSEEIVNLIAQLRREKVIIEAADVSTRTALNVAKLVAFGYPVGDSFRVCLANGRPQEVKTAIDDILKGR